MTITKNMNGTALEIALEGRLDTMTSPDLEKELNASLPSAESLTFDLAKLEYISSAGLRLLVTLQKKAVAGGHSMVLRNTNAVVNEVFRVSGFNKTFKVL